MNRHMGRRRKSNLDLPPRMHLKSGTYYYVTSSSPRKWIPLSKDLSEARIKWAEQENGSISINTIGKLIEDYFNSDKFKKTADGTQRMYRSVSKQVIGFFGNTDVSAITTGVIAQFMDGMESKAQANIGKAVISNALSLAVRYDMLQHNPAKEIERHKLEPRMRYVTDEEFRKIRDCANPVLRSAMNISYITGARISDVLAIKMSDWTEKGLIIRQIKTKKLQLFERTPELEEVIAEARKIPRTIRGISYLLCSNRGQMYSTSTLRDFWIEARDKAGVKDVRFHDIRGKSATDAKHDGQDYQALLGHSTRAMSDRYIKIEEAQKVAPRKRSL
jgi:integrase